MVVLSIALLLSTGQAAPSLSPAAQENFKSWFTKGESLYAEGDYGTAIHAFRQADKIKTTPEVAYDLAKCHEKLGDQAFATFYYRQYLRRAPTAGDALEVAEILGDALAKAEQDGRGLLEVDGSEAATVTVAGVSYPDFPVAVFLPPGDHEILAQFASNTIKRTASIVGGRVTSVQVDRVQPPLLAYGNDPVSSSWGTPAGVDDSASVAKSGPTNTRALLHTGSMGLIAAGAAALITGIAFGVMSSADRSQLENNKSQLTVTEGRGLARSAASRAGTANVFLALGLGAGAIGGVGFVLTLPEPGMNEGGASP